MEINKNGFVYQFKRDDNEIMDMFYERCWKSLENSPKTQEELEKEKRLEESKKELEKQKKAIEELERIRKLEAEYINNSSLIETTQENQVDTKPIQELNQESNKQEDLESINIPIYRPNISSKN